MNFGVKIWSTNLELMQKAYLYFKKGEFDYVELTSVVGSFDKVALSGLQNIPSIVHCDNNGVNFAKRELYGKNALALKTAQKFADFLGSKYIIVHPGYEGVTKEVNKLLGEFKDNRICVENMPGKIVNLTSECIGRTYDELRQIDTEYFCLDFSHAIKAAVTLRKDPFLLIEGLKALHPVVYHISGGVTKSEVDEHLNINEGDFDLKQIVGFIEDTGCVTVETPKVNLKDLDADVKNIKRLKSIVSRMHEISNIRLS